MSTIISRLTFNIDKHTLISILIVTGISSLYAVTPKLSLLLFLLCFSLIFFIKKEWTVYALIIVLFFEGHAFSFHAAGARIRVAQLVEITGLLILFLLIITNRLRLVKTPLDIPLLAYVAINFLAVTQSPVVQRGVKISILILSLMFLYYMVVNIVRTRKVFDTVFKLLLYAGIIEVLFGLYQVLAGISVHYLGINMPIGHLGLAHTDYINSPWGRPYGTLPEPDWYGAVCLFYAILFSILYFSRLESHRKLYFWGMIISSVGLLFSFVRASWVGFIAGLFVASLISHKVSLSRLRPRYFLAAITVLIVITMLLFAISPGFRGIIDSRISTISGQSVRLLTTIHAINLFLQKPILGNGPGCYTHLGIWGNSDELHDLRLEAGVLRDEEKYDPNIITTILSDTGIIGTIAFLVLLWVFVKYNFYAFKKIRNEYQIISFALFGAIVGLFVSYVFSTGFWMPFTWVFVALNICAIKIGYKVDESTNRWLPNST
ncbi:MAG: hypothetical protein GF315_02485 [candidate division Zixibacteria bacterium]|nr:hypothetical protein [candidate division Zixibacteria bacterium]